MTRPLRLLLALFFGLASGASAAEPAAWVRGEILVKFRSEGPYALVECAETLTRRGRSLRDAAADRSDSLDRITARLGVRGVRALFRRPDGTPLAEQRRRSGERLSRRVGRAAATAPDLAQVYRLRVPREVDSYEAAARLREDPHVEWAQPNFRAQATAVFDDPFLATSGSFGQPYPDLWGLERIGAPAAWDLSLGEGVLAAVVDSGVDYRHPDLAANAWVNAGEDRDGDGLATDADRNGVDDDGNGFVDDVAGFDFANTRIAGEPDDVVDPDPMDDFGHGTHVAGTLAGVAGNALGIAGVAPRARVMAVKGLDEFGGGEIAGLAAAIVYAAENGARVINNSWGCAGRCPENPAVEEAVRFAHALGAVVVFSAGNSADDVVWSSPQNLREPLVVAATREDDERAGFSNVGFLLDVAAPGAGVPVPPPALAPGSNILSLRAAETSPFLDGGGNLAVAGKYLRLSGTSMSAPHVAGLAALLLAHHPEWGPEEVQLAVRLSALDVGPPGHDRLFGAGRIRADVALALVLPRVRGEIRSPARRESVTRSDGVAITGTASGEDLASWQLFVGEGNAPAVFEPLGPPRTDPVEDAPLGVWTARGRADGAYLLRLDLVTRDGARLAEFAPIALELQRVTRVSSPGAPALTPAVSGDLVAWHSARSVPPDATEPQLLNVFVTDLRSGREHAVATGPGRQLSASISGRRIVWQDEGGAHLYDFVGCTLDRRTGACPHVVLRSGPEAATPPVVSGDRLVWSEVRGGELDVLGCGLGRRTHGCEPRALVAPPADQYLPDLDRGHLVWIDFSTGFPNVWSCLLPRRGAGCNAAPLEPLERYQFDARVSGDLVVWNDLRRQLRICRVDPGTRSCRSLGVPRQSFFQAADVSGDVVVWADFRDDDLELFFCEYDRVTETCPVQQLTRHPANQLTPSIDGSRVVFEDDRTGVRSVFAIDLPTLAAPGDRHVREGRPLVVRVVARDPYGEPPLLRAAQADGAPLEAIGAAFVDLGDGSGEFRWRPARGQAGEYAVTFVAETARPIATSESIRITVQPGATHGR